MTDSLFKWSDGLPVGGGDMEKSVYDTDDDGKVDAAETADQAAEANHAAEAEHATTADSVPWAGVTGKPEIDSGTYTVAWTATTTNPTLGDGTLVGRFSKAGKLVAFTIDLTIGSTTNLGSGDWRFSLPFASVAATYIFVTANDIAPTYSTYLGSGLISTSTIVRVRFEAARTTNLKSTTPFNWAAGDELHINGVFITA